MTLVTAAMLVLLGGSLPAHAPDLQVEAATAAGVSLPELADAVARALVASGARVVLGGPTSAPCQYCAKVVVTEARPGEWRVEVGQDRHKAAANLHLPAGSQLFDRARAIAIQARLLVTWETGEEPKNREATSRSPARKPETRPTAERPLPPSEAAAPSSPSAPPPVYERLPSASELVPAPAREPAAVAERRPESAPAAPVERSEASPRPEPRAERRPEVKPREAERTAARALPPAPPAEVAAGPAKPLWPWIPTAVGVAAGLGAGICALWARSDYNGLSDRNRSYGEAKALKSNGERLQLASFVLTGVAVAGIGTGIVGFVTRTPNGSSVSAAASPIPGGGMIAIAGAWP